MYETHKKRMLLISNSFAYGRGYLEHCASAIRGFLGPIDQITFVPYALKDWDRYTAIAREGFAKMGITVHGIHESCFESPEQAVAQSQALFVGGGNTFRLLNELYKYGPKHNDLLFQIWRRVTDGQMVYLGASAGVNVACPTIMTTNDMPIVQPPSLRAISLFYWQINPHFIDADPNTKHMGETREKRIAEFQEENGTFVIGLREGSWILVENGVARLQGETGAKLFQKGEEPREWDPTKVLVMS